VLFPFQELIEDHTPLRRFTKPLPYEKSLK